MPDLTGFGRVTKDPGAYDYAHLGTAAGTTTIFSNSCFLSHIQINNGALGTVIIYDSVGTSLNVIGSVAIQSLSGTQPPQALLYKVRTKQGLTISNTANLDLTVAAV